MPKIGIMGAMDLELTFLGDRLMIVREHSPHCVEMEGAAIAHVAHLNGSPFVAHPPFTRPDRLRAVISGAPDPSGWLAASTAP
jgi:hypothetical protein